VNCSGVQERLSLFHDNELSPSRAALVATHVTNCSSCAAELTSFQQLSGLTRQLTDSPAPDHLWDELQAKLNDTAAPTKSLLRFQPNSIPARQLVPGRLLTLAATILVTVGIGVVSYWTWFSYGHNHLAVDFTHYVENFAEQPGNAQQILLAKHEGRPVTLTEATDILGYEPVAAKGLPPGYSLEQVNLLTMPCCICAQVIFTNKAGESIAIFEYAIDQPVWFGNRPTIERLCLDIPTSVMQVDDRLVATWKEGKRYITIIGATDLNEVTEFVAHFSKVSSAKR